MVYVCMSTCECTWRKSISCESTPTTQPHVHIPPNSTLHLQGMVSLKNSACLHVEGHLIQVMQLLWLSHWESCWTSVIKHAGDYSRSTDATCKSHTHTLHTLHTRAILTRAQTLTRPCPCATCNWLLHPAPTSVQDWWCPSCHQLAQILHVHLQWTCNLSWWCFSCTH